MSAQEFLSTIFADKEPHSFIHMFSEDPVIGVRNLWFDNVEGAVKFAERNATGHHVYAGILPRTCDGGMEVKDVVTAGNWIWLDSDEPKNQLWRALPPTLVVSSGRGMHAYWKLDDFYPADKIQEMCKAVAMKFGADATVFNLNRMMRVPGTQNIKTDPPRQCFIYAHEDFQYTYLDMARFLSLDATTITRIVDGNTRGLDGDRSRRDQKVICALMMAGLDEKIIAQVFAANKVGDKMEEDGPAYFRHSLQRARDLLKSFGAEPGSGGGFKIKGQAKSQPETVDGEDAGKPPTKRNLDLPDAPLGAELELFSEHKDGTYLMGRKVASFVLEPKRRVVDSIDSDFTQALIVDAHSPWGTQRGLILTPDTFHNIPAMLRAIKGFGGTWVGNKDSDVRKFQGHILAQAMTLGLPKVAQATCTGRIGHVWLTKNQCIGPHGPFDEDTAPVVLADEKLHTPPVHYDFPEDDTAAREALVQLYTLLPQVNKPDTIWPIIGWFFASLWRPIFLTHGIMYPFLNMFGTTGAGKTQTLQKIFLPLMGYSAPVPQVYDLETTKFGMLGLLTGTNALPVAFGEYRVSLLKNIAMVRRYLLTIYDQTEDVRGNRDRTMDNYTLSAPPVINGEDMVDDENHALLQRVIQAQMDPEVSKRGTSYYNAFQAVTTLPLRAIASHLILFSLNHSPRIADAQSLLTQGIPDLIDERIMGNLIAATCGMLFFEDVCRDAGADVKPLTSQLLQEIWQPMLKRVTGAFGRQYSVFDEMVTDVVRHAYNVDEWECEYPFKISTNKRYFSFNMTDAYAWWIGWRRLRGLPSIERTTLSRQMGEQVKHYVDSTGHNVGINGHTHRCVVIDLERAGEYGLDLPDQKSGEGAQPTTK